METAIAKTVEAAEQTLRKFAPQEMDVTHDAFEIVSFVLLHEHDQWQTHIKALKGQDAEELPVQACEATPTTPHPTMCIDNGRLLIPAGQRPPSPDHLRSSLERRCSKT